MSCLLLVRAVFVVFIIGNFSGREDGGKEGIGLLDGVLGNDVCGCFEVVRGF